MNPEVAALMALLKSGDSSYDLLVMRLNSDTEIEGCLNDQDQDGNTLLHHLVQNRAINCLRYIFSKTGIDIYKTNNSQKTAVETIPEKATQVQREEIINLFHQYEVRQLWAKIEKSQKEAYAVKSEFEEFTKEYDGDYCGNK